MTHKLPITLGLDPGTRFLGAAVLRGRELAAYGVHVLKNGGHPVSVIDQTKRIVFRYIAAHAPAVVAIEEPYLLATERAALLTTLVRELQERASEVGVRVVKISPETVRRNLTGSEKATKYEVAQALASSRFPQLAALVPKKPKVPALWLSSRERYWLHMFDALALATVTGYSSFRAGTANESKVE